MAGIDKIYGTYGQYIELRDWLKNNERSIESITGFDGYHDIIEDVLPSEYIYQGPRFDMEIAISNFPEEVDECLWDNCPISFVRDRLMEQHGWV